MTISNFCHGTSHHHLVRLYDVCYKICLSRLRSLCVRIWRCSSKYVIFFWCFDANISQVHSEEFYKPSSSRSPIITNYKVLLCIEGIWRICQHGCLSKLFSMMEQVYGRPAMHGVKMGNAKKTYEQKLSVLARKRCIYNFNSGLNIFLNDNPNHHFCLEE